MAFLNKHVAMASIKKRTIYTHGQGYTTFEVYLGTNPLTRKPVRKSSKSIEKLRKMIADFYQRVSSGGDSAVLLSPFQAMDARNALDTLVKAGLNITLTECVRRVIEDNLEMPAQCTTTLREAFEKYYKQQETDGKSYGHLKSLRHRVGAWVEKFGGNKLVSDVTAKNLAEYLETTFIRTGEEKEKTTYNGRLDYIKTFVKWCAAPEQGYIRESPIATMKPKVKGYVQPEYMKPEDVKKLFDVLEAKGGPDLAYAILSFFCGMRQEEILRASEGPLSVEIDVAEKYIVVKKCKGSTRGVKPRAFTIPAQALAWMQSMPDFVSAARTRNNKFRDHLVDAAREAGLGELPINAGRHTFCTMFEAAHHDSNALSAIVGNTEDVRDHHYNGVAKPQEGRDYFTILPTAATASGQQQEPSAAQ